MSSKPPQHDVDESALEVTTPKTWAAGIPGVLVSLDRAVEQMGVSRTVKTLRLLNQREGFDCPGCAWPEPQGHRKMAEFCENGAKAVAEEATKRRIGPEFFAAHPVGELGDEDRLLARAAGQAHRADGAAARCARTTTPISWDSAFTLIAEELNALSSPDEAVFYTSGRTSNEAAFLYQLLVRSFGTNNLPDCSNMCHESSGAALNQTIGIGKGSVSIKDFELADLIVVVGQNPGTNHPRMLGALEDAKKNGAKIIAVNPLPEAGLMRFKNPQNISGLIGKGTALCDEFVQIRVGGDQALFQAIGHLLLQWDKVDKAFIESKTHGFDEYAEGVRELDWDRVVTATGLTREQITRVAGMFVDSQRTIVVLGHGTHAAQALGADHPGGRQRDVPARHDR